MPSTSVFWKYESKLLDDDLQATIAVALDPLPRGIIWS